MRAKIARWLVAGSVGAGVSLGAHASPMTTTKVTQEPRERPQPSPQAPPAQRPPPQKPPPSKAPPQRAPDLQRPPANAQAPSPQHFTDPHGFYGSRWVTGAPSVGEPVVTGGGWSMQVSPGTGGDPIVGIEDGEAPVPVRKTQPALLSLSVDQLGNLMGDPLYSTEGRLQAADELMASGKEAIPVLIKQLGDARPYAEVETGPGQARRVITVGQQSEEMLYALITPRYRSPHTRAMKARSRTMYRVADWQAWWRRNQSRSLEEIHAELRPVIDAYWTTQGTEQVVR